MTAKLRILLVEDHDDTLRLMAKLLRYSGHEVHAAASAQDALALAAEQGRCDLLVSDIGLPDRTGFELMRELRSLYPTDPMPGIAMTGYGEDHSLRDCEQAGFARHLLKPISFDHLLAAIDEVMSRVPTPGETPGVRGGNDEIHPPRGNDEIRSPNDESNANDRMPK